MTTQNLGGRGARLWFLFAFLGRNSGKKKNPFKQNFFGFLYEFDVCLAWILLYICGAEMIIFLMNLVTSAEIPLFI